MKNEEDKKVFYERCAEIPGIEHVYRTPFPRRNRWNNRLLGNGRYPGFGLIQCYGSSVRVISKHGTRMFASYKEVYDYLLLVLPRV